MTAQLVRHRFTIEEYERMGETGIIAEGTRVELIDGEIVEMAPIGDGHVTGLNLLANDITIQLHGQAFVSVQNPIRLPPYGEPQPDLVVIRQEAVRKGVPALADILLVIEVADSTLATDRAVKLPLYAAAEIAEAWLVNIQGREIERHTMPSEGRYRQVATARAGQSLTSTVLPQLVIRADLLFD